MKRKDLAACFLAVFAVAFSLAVLRGLTLWQVPMSETADFAVNALYIERASHLAELTGNYSRFHFNHPGPAFFYFYALGEALFFRTGLVPEPMNAQMLTISLLQCAFLAWGMVAIYSQTRSIALVGLATTVGLWLFPHGAFHSTWPPHQFIMGFWCATVSAAWAAGGRWNWLPVFTLTACLCVHAHVAQGLFMAFLFGYVGLFMVRGPRPPRAPVLVSLLLLALFVLPAFLDMARGAPNAKAIWRHLQGERSRPTWEQVLGFQLGFASFPVGDETPPVAAAYLAENPLRVGLFWGVAWLSPFLVLALPKGRQGPWPHLAVISLGLLALTWVWALCMDPPMFPFNSFFIYAVEYIPIVLWCYLLVPANLHVRRVTGLLSGAALVVLLGRAQVLPCEDVSFEYPYLIDPGLQRWIAQRRERGVEVFLDFPHDLWPQAASILLGLQRQGVGVYVGSFWTFMFQGPHDIMSRTSERVLEGWQLVETTDPRVPAADGLTLPMYRQGRAHILLRPYVEPRLGP